MADSYGAEIQGLDALLRELKQLPEVMQQRVMKGAVRTIAEVCGLQAAEIEALAARGNASALKGYRTLAVARGPAARNKYNCRANG